MTDEKIIYEVTMHGRGGQGAITAALLLCEIAYADGFKDVLSIPKIGAERRGAPIKAFSKLSPKNEIKNYSATEDADFTIIFDPTLLSIPGVADGIKHGTVLINTNADVDVSIFPKECKIYTVPVTDIALKLNLLASGYPILNVPLLGALTKVKYKDEAGERTLGLHLETIKKIADKKFGSKGILNYEAAVKAAEQVKELR
ncbi:2-oxoacid:acceptor oxidoreductase family protein [Promethearchaeum syntrophicum]|uniref:pyruvate synthase n=1 Tax=Promethearchaeum syntrophicum TaxID=2594042 RepID=A0A5B9D6I0_9ARCH|nr:2-oxoacid:acceptor oxidoreductase family protein [Candidatus Prometheoarchaeum syntrophicum]QEE14642.1 Pyruvate synthase subunit PorC [Candidatus Prometheoarchaeum syntrophicum]